jgi:acetoin:2,6-dichlorophenolindophenol oxidoreductase subunit beta
MIFVKYLRDTLDQLLAEHEEILLIGEDIKDPYGGAFKVTQGLSTKYPHRVISTPISEAGIVGIASGLALDGWRPIVEIMFGDFMTLTFDQVINHISKYERMYNGKVSCPVIMRTPMGGGRGYGPTHSQTIEKFFLGIPNFNVYALSLYLSPGRIFDHILQHTTPCLLVEHKLLYPQKMCLPHDGYIGNNICSVNENAGALPVVSISPVPIEECNLTVLAYGFQAYNVEQLIQTLAINDEIFIHLLVISDLSQPDIGAIIASIQRTRNLLIVEESTPGGTWGNEILATLSHSTDLLAHTRCYQAHSLADVIPCSPEKETAMLVNQDKIEKTIKGIFH